MAGHPFAGLARFTVAAKSPLTEGIGESRCEGPFGMAQKRSGADAIIIRGAATSPTSVLIDAITGDVTFHDATILWGMPVAESADRLQAAFGPEIHTALIGAAGENRPQVADAATCAVLTESYAARMRDNPLTRWQLDPPGFSAWLHTHGTDAALCVRNYRESGFDAADQYRPEKFMSRYLRDGNRPGCPNKCIKMFRDIEGTERAIHREISEALGPNCGISDLETVFRANVQCNEPGLDPTSLGFTLSMAMECVERGLLTAPLRFGDSDAMLQMIDDIAYRRGWGDLLAEGSRRAAQCLGGDASKYALHVKGLEMFCLSRERKQT